MRAALPFLLVMLAIFAAGCIIYLAWELSSDENPDKDDPDREPGDES